MIVIRDVTARKSAEEAIKVSEVNYRAIFNAANDAIFVHDLQTGAVLDVNQRMCEMYGCTVAQARQLTVASFSSNETPYTDQEARVLVEKAASGTPQLFEWHAKKMTGELFWVEVNLRPVSLNGQECVLAVVRDITERKRAEHQLAQSHRRVSEILESIGDAFCSVDKALRFTYVNRKAEELWAMRREDLIGRDYLTVFPQAIGSRAYQEISRSLAQNLQLNFEALSVITNRWVDISLYPTPGGLSIYFRDITDRKEAFDKLRQSEEQFGKAFRANPQPMSITAVATGRYLDVNESFLNMSGYTRDEVIGHTSLELSIWETPQARADFIRELRTKGRVRNFETRFRVKQGSLRVLLSSAEQLEIAGEQCLLFASSDITERIKAEDALRTSEARLTLAHQASRMGTFEWNIQTGVNIWSPELEAMYGLAPGTFGGTQHTWEDLVHPGDRAHAVATVTRAFASEGAVEDEWRVRWPDGSVRWLFGRFQVIKDAGSEPWLLTGINIDVTERILAQQAIQESEARFRHMADTAPVMIWLAGEDKGCTYFNQQWLVFTGRTMEQELGNGWANGVHPSDFDQCLNIYETAFDGRRLFTMEYRLRRADGAYRWVIDNGTPRFSTTGEFLGYIGSCVDITDRKESEASLVVAHQALETAYAEVNRLKTQLEEENIYLQEEIKLQHNFGEIVGNSDSLRYVLYKIEQVAPTDSTVLIMGETGTGKELVARAIHTASLRRDRPLVKVSCAALSASLIESELFGHEKGAFTGAIARKVGRFELADGATIFLDEIGELPLELQVKLLRVIQEGELERLGSARTFKVDVRIIAATNRNLREQVSKGLFREDLWYRLEVFPITVPPLRQRRGDIPMLTEHFVKAFARKIGKDITSIAPATISALRNYAWPGNVRELANVIERAVINSQSPVLRLYEQLDPASGAAADALGRTLEEVERDYIVRVLDNLSWKIEGPNGAARALGLNPSTLRTRMGKLRIAKPTHRTARHS